MTTFKNFLQSFRRLCLDSHHLALGEAVTPKIKEYIRKVINVKIEDGQYHTYYGEVKKIITSFINYTIHAMDNIILEADRYSHVATKQELLELADKTINIYVTVQIDFGKEYLPVQSAEEKQNYEEILKMHDLFIENMYNLRATLDKFNKQENVNDFVKDHFKISVEKSYEKFQFAHTYLSLMLADELQKIRISLEEILLRMRNNLRKVQEDYNENTSSLLNQLYDKNKEHLEIARREKKNSVDSAEVMRGIEKVREKIRHPETNGFETRLEEEIEYWEGRLREFDAIAQNLIKLKTEEENVAKQEKTYNSLRTTELPGSKYKCWQTIGENYKQRKDYIKNKIIEESKTLISFFCIRGIDRVIYANTIGAYNVDEWNHQVYIFDHGMGVYHVDCEGEFLEVSDNEKYYYDENGRYIYEDGVKLYQCAPCTSKYNIDTDTLLAKVTKECGHSDNGDGSCKMAIKDLTDVEILPASEPIDIARTLDSETVKYLWDSLGGILPDALHDVAELSPKNPIHFLAHRLLIHKHDRTLRELRKKSKEAQAYKISISKERKEKAVRASKAWKAQQVKRRKPEESDDTLDWAALNAYNAEKNFIISQNYFNY